MPLPPVLYTILDGGMGTTLEDSGYNVSSNLWSSDPALRSAVRDVHKGFLEAGAEMIGTATYQACESLYTQDEAMSSAQARELMLSQVAVAVEAVGRTSGGGTFEGKEKKEREEGKKIGLCLGPFGATLQPGQEYSGLYPAPYGPSPTSTITTPSSFTSSLISLREFHLARLLTYAQDKTTWDSIDWICFETIPLVRESLAIRLALRDLWRTLDERDGPNEEIGKKKVWMAYVFPRGGEFPDGSSIREVVRSALVPEPFAPGSGLTCRDMIEEEEIGLRGRLPVPDAIGINCTSPAHILGLGREFTTHVSEIFSEGKLAKEEESIGFVLYPDGGLVYDPTTRSWSVPSGIPTAGGQGGNWAKNVAMVAKEVGESTRTRSVDGSEGKDGEEVRVWEGGVLVGGCCKNGFEEIRGLRDELKPKGA